MPKPPEQQSEHPATGLTLFKRIFLWIILGLNLDIEMICHIGHGWLFCRAPTRAVAVALPYGWLILWTEKARKEGYTDSLWPLATLPSVLLYLMTAQWFLSILVRHRVHSRYTGYPVLKLPFFFIGETLWKRWVQPFALGLLGWHFYHVNRPIMSLLIAASVSSFLVGRLRSLQAMHDGQGITDAMLE